MLESATSWDWFLLIVAALSVLLGLWRGMVRTVFALAAWVAALAGTPIAAPMLLPLVAAVPVWVVYVLLFLGIFVAVRVIGSLAARLLQGAGLGGADRLLGGLIGVARAAIVVLVVAVVAHVAGFSKRPAWQQAVSRPLLDAMVQWVEPYLPERVSGIRRI